MKKLSVFILSVISFVMLLFLASCDTFKSPEDRIDSYKIDVTQREDGTLDFTYEILWYVVEDAGEPLTWVEIGIPNLHADSVKALSNDVSDAYLYEDEGEYIRCDLSSKKYTGDTADIKFSYHLNRLYEYDDTTFWYEFTPGWFNDIVVKNITVTWDAANVVSANAMSQKDGKYVWMGSLEKGEHFKEIKVTYNRADYPNLITEMDNSDESDYRSLLIFILVCVGIAVAVAVIVSMGHRYGEEAYFTYRGFSGNYYGHNWLYYHLVFHSGRTRTGHEVKDPRPKPTSSGSSGGHSCACACACACAGGGRAGCARKEFYNPNLNADEFVNKLRK